MAVMNSPGGQRRTRGVSSQALESETVGGGGGEPAACIERV